MDIWGNDKPKKKLLSKGEWEFKKTVMGNKCVICGTTDKKCGGLERAHIKAKSKGGSEVVPMCAICHKKYDSGKLTATQLKKIGLSPETYKKLICLSV